MSPPVLLFLSLLCLLLHASSATDYLSDCASANDHGWPRFNSLDELISSPEWASYFNAVFGALPTTYPVCTYDLELLNKTAYDAAGLSGSRPLVANTSALVDGDLFQSSALAADYQIFHSAWAPIPNDTYVEVTHAVYPTELSGMWVWRTRGSGIFYNTGNTLVFPTPADPMQIHADAIDFLSANCSIKPSVKWPQLESDVFGFCAREKGYDSVQFEPQEGEVPMGTFGIPGLTEMVLVNLDGDKNCGVEDPTTTTLRMGWKAAEQCACANLPIPDQCGVMAYPPLPPVMVEPKLCAAQASDPDVACNGALCTFTSCAV
jgi:hypothetical protein